ncbi:MAG: TonB-dependent receptor [Acidobacteria bacterium]|nr:TonB-dependent receptor [Acidobacteriota bacterium]
MPLGMITSRQRGWQNQFAGTGGGDWTINEKNQLRVRYSHNELENSNAFATLPSFAASMRSKGMLGSAAWYANVMDAFTNELRFGFNRYTHGFGQANMAFPGLTAFPNIQIGGLSNLALGLPFNLATNARLNTYHLADGAGVQIGPHNVRFGIDGRRYLGFMGGFTSGAGNFAFSSLDRFLLDLPPDVAASRTFGVDRLDMAQWHWFAYLQDNWRVAPGFTLDLGLRYQYSKLPAFIKRQANLVAADVPGVISFEEPNEQTQNWAPHAGFAWQPNWWNGMTVIRGSFGIMYDALYSAHMVTPMMGQLGLTQLLNPASNVPGFFRFGAIRDAAAGRDLTPQELRGRIATFFGEQRLPYTMHWNAAIQQSIWNNGTIELKYLGSRGLRLPVLSMMGALPRVTPERSLPLFFSTPTQGEINQLTLTLDDLQRQPFSSLQAAGFSNPVWTVLNEGQSWYHGLAVSLNQRFTRGFQLISNWTWSHLIDDSTGTVLDLGMFGRERANSIYDRRHRVSVTPMFELAPLFGDGSFLAKFFADFNLNATYTYESPMYLTPLGGADVLLNGNPFGARAIFNAQGREGVTSGVMPVTNRAGRIVGYQTLDPNARFISGAPGVFSFGNRSSFRLGETNNLDLAAVKRFNISDRGAFEVRGEVYNIFNHPQFTGTQINSLGSRFIQSMPGFLTAGNPEFGNFEPAFFGNPRTLQLALRVTF